MPAGRQVARNTSIGRDQKQVAVLAVEVAGPVTKHQLGENLRFDFRLRLLIVALLVAGIVFAIGPDRRHKQNALAIGRPGAAGSFG